MYSPLKVEYLPDSSIAAAIVPMDKIIMPEPRSIVVNVDKTFFEVKRGERFRVSARIANKDRDKPNVLLTNGCHDRSLIHTDNRFIFPVFRPLYIGSGHCDESRSSIKLSFLPGESIPFEDEFLMGNDAPLGLQKFHLEIKAEAHNRTYRILSPVLTLKIKDNPELTKKMQASSIEGKDFEREHRQNIQRFSRDRIRTAFGSISFGFDEFGDLSAYLHSWRKTLGKKYSIAIYDKKKKMLGLQGTTCNRQEAAIDFMRGVTFFSSKNIDEIGYVSIKQTDCE